MSEIPKDIMEKIEEKFKHGELYSGTQPIEELIEYNTMVDQLRFAAIFGYQLAAQQIADLQEQYGIMDGRRRNALKSLEESEKQFGSSSKRLKD